MRQNKMRFLLTHLSYDSPLRPILLFAIRSRLATYRSSAAGCPLPCRERNLARLSNPCILVAAGTKYDEVAAHRSRRGDEARVAWATV